MRIAVMVLALMTMTALGGCNTQHIAEMRAPAPQRQSLKPVILTAAQKNVVERAVRAQLKDPDSARFGVMRAGQGEENNITICGLVNAKNGFGGYTGFGTFMGALAGGKFDVVGMAGGSEEMTFAVNKVCADWGLTPQPGS